MSGFFAMRRETFATGRRLTPLGYKVGLELMCKCRVGIVQEVPIHFDARSHGQSKLTLREQFRYLEHLSRLYDFHFPHASPIAKFLIATGISWLVGFGAYLVMVPLIPRAGRIAAPVAAYPAAILTTAIFHARYVRTQRQFLLSPGRGCGSGSLRPANGPPAPRRRRGSPGAFETPASPKSSS